MDQKYLATVDYSLPISVLLHDSIKRSHEEAGVAKPIVEDLDGPFYHDIFEKNEGAKNLLRGTLPKEEYIRLLMMLWHVYDAFERGLNQHSTSNPVLKPTYNPALLARAPSIAADISYLLGLSQDEDWRVHPMHMEMVESPPPALAAYISRIEELTSSDLDSERSLLLAHAYTRYLGDLSGGQAVKRVMTKAYGLDPADNLGVQFYVFYSDGNRTSKPLTVIDFNKIKQWYRNGMDKGCGEDKELKARILAETERTFQFNIGLFGELKGSTVSPCPRLKTNAAGNAHFHRGEKKSGMRVPSVADFNLKVPIFVRGVLMLGATFTVLMRNNSLNTYLL